MQSLGEMHVVAGGKLTLEEFVSQLLESAVADYRLRTQDCSPLPKKLGNDQSVCFLVKAPEKNGRCKFSDEDIAMIRELADEGMKSPAIARRFAVTPQTIRRYLSDD